MLTACQENGLEPDTLSTGNDDLVEVKVGMSLGDDASTRMSEANTQGGNVEGGSFTLRDIDYLFMVPFATYSYTDDPPVSLTSQRLRKGNLFLSLNDITTNKQVRKRLYFASLIPSGTKSFLTYAHPTGGGPEASSADKFTYGSLVANGLDGDVTDMDAGSIGFTPDLIADDDSEAAYNEALSKAQLMANGMTNLANANYKKDGKTVYWRDQKGMAGQQFSAFTHDGNTFAFVSGETLNSRLSIIQNADYDDQSLKNAIKNANIYASQWKNYTGMSNLPAGLIAFKWDDVRKRFIVLTAETSKAYLNPPITDYSTMAYPAQLWYYANSNIRTASNSSLTSDQIKDIFINGSDWSNVVLKNDVFKSEYGGGIEVNSRSTVVAIDKSLNYGVSRLKMRIKTSAGNLPANDSQTIQNSLIQWRGVLLTHQHQAGFDFQPLSDESYYVIYDSYVKKRNKDENITLSTSFSDDNANHTLVIPSLENEVMYVIAEFYNNSSEIWITGNKGCLIPPKSFFYVIGKLDPASAKTPGTKVFESDHYTAINAVLNNFEGAYSYVPDLSSPSLVLGLQLDLSWAQTEPKSVWLH